MNTLSRKLTGLIAVMDVENLNLKSTGNHQVQNLAKFKLYSISPFINSKSTEKPKIQTVFSAFYSKCYNCLRR